MRYPAFLREGQTIGFVAPSFGAATEPYYSAFLNAVKQLKNRGYQAQFGPNVFLSCGVGISATPEQCGKELEDFYTSKNNDVLISVGGGELMCEDLDHIDFKRISDARPKWYMGYSDNTNFTFLLTTLADTASIYGPCASAFGMSPWHPCVSDALDLLTGKNLTVHGYDKYELVSLKDEDHPYATVNATEPTQVVIKNWDGTPVTGRTIGGCMDVLVNFLGTCYDAVPAFVEKYREDGIIWFLEACDLSVFGIRRAMWQMAHAGWFRHVKAFIIGRPLLMDPVMNLDRYDAIMAVAGKYNVPVIMDCDIGHIDPMMPMLCGGLGTVRPYGDRNIQVSYQLI